MKGVNDRSPSVHNSGEPSVKDWGGRRLIAIMNARKVLPRKPANEEGPHVAKHWDAARREKAVHPDQSTWVVWGSGVDICGTSPRPGPELTLR